MNPNELLHIETIENPSSPLEIALGSLNIPFYTKESVKKYEKGSFNKLRNRILIDLFGKIGFYIIYLLLGYFIYILNNHKFCFITIAVLLAIFNSIFVDKYKYIKQEDPHIYPKSKYFDILAFLRMGISLISFSIAPVISSFYIAIDIFCILYWKLYILEDFNKDTQWLATRRYNYIETLISAQQKENIKKIQKICPEAHAEVECLFENQDFSGRGYFIWPKSLDRVFVTIFTAETEWLEETAMKELYHSDSITYRERYYLYI